MGSYTTQQKAFVFSLISNAASSVPCEFEAAILEKFENVTIGYSKYIGTGWSIAWGPVVLSEKSDLTPQADNALMVVRGTDASGKPLYIVATAGTNPKSFFALFQEDVAVALVPFAGGGKITRGTQTGLTNLLGMTSDGVSLQKFLDSQRGSDATLVFTGHSLGGALTPALALSIDTSGWGEVYAMPTAGPTIGDAGFLAAFTAKFPAPAVTTDPTSTWNCNIVNQLDLVPKAWTDISGISGLYPQLGPPTPCAIDLQKWAAALVQSPKEFAGIRQVTFARGFVQPTPPPPVFGQHPPILLFFAEALYQHSTAYAKELVPDLIDAFPGVPLTKPDCLVFLGLCAAAALLAHASA